MADKKLILLTPEDWDRPLASDADLQGAGAAEGGAGRKDSPREGVQTLHGK